MAIFCPPSGRCSPRLVPICIFNLILQLNQTFFGPTFTHECSSWPHFANIGSKKVGRLKSGGSTGRFVLINGAGVSGLEARLVYGHGGRTIISRIIVRLCGPCNSVKMNFKNELNFPLCRLTAKKPPHVAAPIK